MNNKRIPQFGLDSTKWLWTNFKLKMALCLCCCCWCLPCVKFPLFLFFPFPFSNCRGFRVPSSLIIPLDYSLGRGRMKKWAALFRYKNKRIEHNKWMNKYFNENISNIFTYKCWISCVCCRAFVLILCKISNVCQLYH